MALAWVIRNKDVSTAIIGARSVNQLDENIKALELLKKFDNNLDDRLDKIFENRPITDTDFRKW